MIANNGQANAQWSPLYDTATIADAASTGASIAFFSARTKSANGRAITNMDKAGELPAGQRFTVFSPRLFLLNCGKLDIIELMTKFAAYLEVSGKVVAEGSIEYWAAGAGIHGAVSTTQTTTTLENWGNGVPDARAVVMFPDRYAIAIEAGEPFKLVLEGTAFTADAAMVIRAILEGVREWPIN